MGAFEMRAGAGLVAQMPVGAGDRSTQTGFDFGLPPQRLRSSSTESSGNCRSV